MRTYMWTRILSAIVAAAALVVAAILKWHSCDLIYDICIGLFSGATFAWIIAFASYRVARREAIMGYLYGLRLYRKKLRRLQAAPQGDGRIPYAEEIEDDFWDLADKYLQIQHLCRKCCKYRKMPVKLDKSFEQVSEIRNELAVGQRDYVAYGKKITEAIDTVEIIVTQLKYMYPPKEDAKDGQA